MIYIIALMISILGAPTLVKAQSGLLDNVKRNPSEARQLCSKFRSLNEKGISSSSKESISKISQERNIKEIDAEILSTYVRALHCPNVF
tara:strand:- start:14196 stop:14462 length:267 start_codon:yes stop_codon:yes gene_type:complete